MKMRTRTPTPTPTPTRKFVSGGSVEDLVYCPACGQDNLRFENNATHCDQCSWTSDVEELLEEIEKNVVRMKKLFVYTFDTQVEFKKLWDLKTRLEKKEVWGYEKRVAFVAQEIPDAVASVEDLCLAEMDKGLSKKPLPVWNTVYN